MNVMIKGLVSNTNLYFINLFYTKNCFKIIKKKNKNLNTNKTNLHTKVYFI